MKFSELLLEPSLQTSIDKLGYAEATPIQVAAMPHLLDGKDISGLAQTGTGKTAAFVIPLMDRILKSRVPLDNLTEEQKAHLTKRSFADWRAQNFILILVPTRELCEQVRDHVEKLGEASGIRSVSVYGGTGYDKQKEAFKNQVEFVVATPGRLIDLYKEHFVDLKQVRAIVFDEADRMFDMGFKDDMKFILSRVPRERQFLVFSATLNFDVLNTAYQFGSEPIEIDVSRDQTKAENVKDEIFHVGQDEKPMYLLSLLKKSNPKQAIIFSNFKTNVERIARFLSDNGVPAMGISSLLTQAQRTRVMEQFRAENEKNILVATDVAARGLDIKGVDMVMNYELPLDAESYVHRIGRTGRAGAEGRALSLVSDRDVDSLYRIEEYLKHKVDIGWMDDADLIREFRPMPREDYGGGRPSFGDRGPRSSGGPRNDRGPRSGGGPRRDDRGPRSGGPRRDDRGPRSGGPRRDDRGPRTDQRVVEGKPQSRPIPRDQQKDQLRGTGPNSGPRPPRQGDRPQKFDRNQKREGRPQARINPNQRKPQQKTPAPGIVGKVSGFFKKLLGQ